MLNLNNIFPNKQFQGKYCLSPFVMIEVTINGDVRMCGCGTWMPATIGNLKEATLKEQEKELGYYRWYEIHIEQQRSDTFYDMRNGNEYRTRGMCRSQYEREMELKEIEWKKLKY